MPALPIYRMVSPDPRMKYTPGASGRDLTRTLFGIIQNLLEIRAGVRPFCPRHVLRRACSNDLPAFVAAPGAEINHPIGRFYHVKVVFDHDDRVAALDEMIEKSNRDSLAGMALPSVGAAIENNKHRDGLPVELVPDVVAETAYLFADAMLIARGK